MSSAHAPRCAPACREVLAHESLDQLFVDGWWLDIVLTTPVSEMAHAAEIMANRAWKVATICKALNVTVDTGLEWTTDQPLPRKSWLNCFGT